MSILNKKRLYCFLAALLVGAASPSAYARPNMWWDHFESAASNQTECVKQAETILTARKGRPTVQRRGFSPGLESRKRGCDRVHPIRR